MIAWLKKLKAPIEEKLVAGCYHERNACRSIALFTLHKAGSTFLSERLAQILKRQKYEIADFAHYNLQKSRPFSDPLKNETIARYIFSQARCFHKAIRSPVNPNWIEQTLVLLVTRDPRDIMTSMYFSLKYSHEVVTSEIAEQRLLLQNTSIDHFVCKSEFLDRIVKKYEDYQAFLGRPNVLHEPYEKIVTQPEASSVRVAKFLSLANLGQALFSEADFTTCSEDQKNHKRQVSPGDHIRKLTPATIQYCNSKIRHLASSYGWKDIDQ